MILYFSVGAVVMKYRYGASGSDIVPNKSFWVMLPFLVKVSDPHTLCVNAPTVLLEELLYLSSHISFL